MPSPNDTSLPAPEDIGATVATALVEDMGSGDLSAALIPAGNRAHARVICRESAVLCGRAWFDETFRQLDEAITLAWHTRDGEHLMPDQLVCEVRGPARAILSGERTALNFLQTLSGTATLARRYADIVAGTGAKVLDTRKTLPGLRRAQKYAVTCGGCHNHRMGLYDAILIKENHIRALGSITDAVRQAKATAPAGVMIEIEVESLEECREALSAGATRLLLDNFDIATLKAAVEITAGRAELEASGNIDLDNLRRVAETGVDYISIGALTKHVTAVDFSMLFEK